MPQKNPVRTRDPGRLNPSEAPSYFIGEAAHYLCLPNRTVRDWVLGRDYPTESGVVRAKPLVCPADPDNRLLSFLNLVELHVIASIRRVHHLQLKAVRRAIDYLRRSFGSSHPLLDRQMMTDGKDLFIHRYGELVNISADGQMHMRAILDAYLRRVEWDDKHIPIRLFPFTRSTVENTPQLIAIDPRIRAGRPCIAGTGIPTIIIAERHKAGDSVQVLVTDYVRSPEEIEEALRYESRAAS